MYRDMVYLKKLFSFIIVLMLLLSTSITSLSLSTPSRSSHIKVLLNGTTLEFDVNPYIKNGRTLVPFRKILEAFGLDVNWNPVEKSVLAKNNITEIYFKIGSGTTYVNNFETSLDVPAEITDGRTFVPLRFIGESMGAEVNWDNTTKTISIIYVNKSYKIGQTGVFGDFSFSVNDVQADKNQNVITISGKVSSRDKKLAVFLYDSSGRFIPAGISITDQDGDLYNFTANAYPSPSDEFKFQYLVLKMVNEQKKFVKIAEYNF